MTNEVDVTVEVAKYNFKEPAFSFPFDEETVYLKKVLDRSETRTRIK